MTKTLWGVPLVQTDKPTPEPPQFGMYGTSVVSNGTIEIPHIEVGEAPLPPFQMLLLLGVGDSLPWKLARIHTAGKSIELTDTETGEVRQFNLSGEPNQHWTRTK